MKIDFNAHSIDLIVYDFDGVMTDNKVFVFQNGREAVAVNRADGLGVDYLRKAGFRQVILSTEKNPIVKARADKLKIEVIQGCEDKLSELLSFCDREGYDLRKVVFVGNDLNDLEAMKVVGFPIAPADAHPDVKKVAKLVTNVKGGDGVVKELAEIILDL